MSAPGDRAVTALGEPRDAEGVALCRYRCPRHGIEHDVAGSPRLARSYAVAVAEQACLCPGTTPWFVRLGLLRSHALAWLLFLVWALNIADFLLTRHAIALGRATEANSIMRHALHVGTLPAFGLKMGVVTVGVLLLWVLRRRTSALLAAALLAAVFSAVVTYQVLWLRSF